MRYGIVTLTNAERRKPRTPSALTGREIERAYVDKGYRGHDAPKPRRVFISGQKRGVFGTIKRELRRRSAIEPLIGHMKEEGHLGRCYLKGHAGDAANAILIAAGYSRVTLNSEGHRSKAKANLLYADLGERFDATLDDIEKYLTE